MSPESGAVNRLRRLYVLLLGRLRRLNAMRQFPLACLRARKIGRPVVPLGAQTRAPLVETLEPRVLLSANLSLVELGLQSGFLGDIQAEINTDVFAAPVPLIGGQLATEAPGQFLLPVNQALAGFELTDPPTVEGIKAELRDTLAEFLATPDGQADMRVQGRQEDANVLFQVSLAHTDYYARALDLDLAMGPQPQMAALLGTGDTVDVLVSWHMELTFGVNDTEFYVVTSARDEITVDIATALAGDFAGRGQVGVFAAEMTADSGSPSNFAGSYVVDLVDPEGDNQVPLEELDSIESVGTLTGSGQAHLGVNASFIPYFEDISPFGSLFNLTVTADASAHYNLVSASTDVLDTDGKQVLAFGDAVCVDFQNVQLDLGTFFSEFVDPTIAKIQEVLDPVKPVIDFLTDPVPIISDLAGEDLTILDLAVRGVDLFGGSTTGVEAARTVIELMDGILDMGPLAESFAGVTDMGSFSAEYTFDLSEDIDPEAYTNPKLTSSQKDDLIIQDIENKCMPFKTFSTDFGGVIQFPFLQDPEVVYRMLLGDTTAELVTFGLDFSMGFNFDYTYPIFPGLLNAELGLEFGAALDLDAGYDCFGVAMMSRALDFTDETALRQSVSDNLYRLADGFYFDDHAPVVNGVSLVQDGDCAIGNPAKDQPEMTITAKLSVGASVGIDLYVLEAKAGVRGYLAADILFDLNDLPRPQTPEQIDYVHEALEGAPESVPQAPYDYDGRVRIGELELITWADAAGIFNYSGDLRAGLEAFVKVVIDMWFFDITLIDESYEIVGGVIYDFNIYQLDDPQVLAGIRLYAPQLGQVDAAGNLLLYMGEYGATSDNGLPGTGLLRQHTSEDRKTTDYQTDEGYRITSRGLTDPTDPALGESLEVTYLVKEWYTDANGQPVFKWVARGKQVFDGVHNVMAFGGAGNDQIMVTANVAADVSFEGGADDDELLYAGTGMARLWGNQGADKLVGGRGNDQLHGGDDDDDIAGGPGDDVLDGGAGKDRLRGESGDDTLIGGSDGDIYLWTIGGGADTFSEGPGAPADPAQRDHVSVRGGILTSQYASIETDDQIELTTQPDGTVHILTSSGTIVLDNVESLGLAGGGGADTVILSDWAASDLEFLTVDLSSPAEGANADGDRVVFQGGPGNDVIDAQGRYLGMPVTDLETGQTFLVDDPVIQLEDSSDPARPREAYIVNCDPDRDTLELLGGAGNDELSILPPGSENLAVRDYIGVIVDGEAGNDILRSVYGDIQVSGGDDTDELHIEDPNPIGPSGSPMELRVAADSILTSHPTTGEHILFFDGMEELSVQLRSAGEGNNVRVPNTMAGQTTIIGGDGTDTVTVVQNTGPLVFDGQGDGLDTLGLDRMDDTNGVSGEVSADAITGFDLSSPVTFSSVEAIRLQLGAGADVVNVRSTVASTLIEGGEGDDRLIVQVVTQGSGDPGPALLAMMAVSGDAGDDEIIVEIPIDPAALPDAIPPDPADPDAPLLGNLAFDVETVRIRHLGDEPTSWRAEDGLVWVDVPLPAGGTDAVALLDLLGAGRTVIEGGSAGTDTLIVADNVADPQRVTIDAGEIRFEHGSTVLSQQPDAFLPAPPTPMSPVIVPGGVASLGTEVLAQSPAPAVDWWNVARNPQASATQSSTLSGGEAQRAIDGNTAGHWNYLSVTHTDANPDNWWQVDLGAGYELDHVVLYNRSDTAGGRLSNFRVSVLLDGQVVYEGDYFTTPGTSVPQGGRCRIDLPSGLTADTVRVQLLGYNNDGNGILSLAEVEVMGRTPETGLVSWQASGAGDLSGARPIPDSWSGSQMVSAPNDPVRMISPLGYTVWDDRSGSFVWSGGGQWDSLDFNWGYGGPVSWDVDGYEIYFSTTINVIQDMDVTFYLGCDDMAYFNIDGTTVIDLWFRVGPYTARTKTIRLTQGYHQLDGYYYEANGVAAVRLLYAVAGQGFETLSYNGYNKYGSAVDVQGDRMVVGAPYESDVAREAGQAYVYEKNDAGNWQQVAELRAPEGAWEDHFGSAVTIWGDTIVVGAPGDDDAGLNTGSVYVFQDTGAGYVYSAKFYAAAGDRYVGDLFGSSLDFDDENLIVGTRQATNSYPRRAYVFRENHVQSWTQIARLTSPSAAPSGEFGWSVALTGDTAVVTDPTELNGRAYVYQQGSTGAYPTTPTATLVGSDVKAGGEFGRSVAIDGKTILVGSPSATRADSAAYVFDRPISGWISATETARLDNSIGYDRFGEAVALDGDLAIVATGDNYAVGFRKTEGGTWALERLFRADYTTSVAVDDGVFADGSVLYNAAFVHQFEDVSSGAVQAVSSTDGQYVYVVRPGYDAEPVNLAAGGLASQSSIHSVGSAYLAIDGNTSGWWSPAYSTTHTANDYNAWWQVELAERSELTTIALHNREDTASNRLSNFRLSVFDGQTEVYGQDCFVGSGYVDRFDPFTVNLPEGLIGDRVRVQFIGRNNANDGYLSLAEVEVFGYRKRSAITVLQRNFAGAGLPSNMRRVDELWDPVLLQGVHDLELAVTGSGPNAFALTDRPSVELLVASGPSLSHWGSLQLDGMARPLDLGVTPDGQALYVIDDDGRLRTYLRQLDGTYLQHGADMTVANASELAVDPAGDVLHVARRSDSAISVFEIDPNGSLTLIQEVSNGRDGIRGLGSVSSMCATDSYLFVTGATDDSLVVFSRGGDGRLVFSQRLRNLAGGIEGLKKPSSLAVDGTTGVVYVASDGADVAAPGGMAWFDIDPSATPSPPWVVQYSGMESLTVRSGGRDDTVRVLGVADQVGDLTVETRSGHDTVIVPQAPEHRPTTVNLGSGDDTMELRGTGDGSTVTILGAEGNDHVLVWSTGPASTVNIDTGEDDDTIRVVGDGLVSPATVLGSNQSDLLEFAGTPDVLQAPIPDGDIHVAGVLAVSYDAIEAVSFLTALPDAHAGGPYALSEGGSLALNASASIIPSGQVELDVEWDVDGDGDFGDVVGRVPPLLSWEDLGGFGLDDDGTYQIAVRVTSDVGYDVSVATVDIANTPPIVSISGPDTIAERETYNLALSASDDGDDTILGWRINWGDGTIEDILSGPPNVTHVYEHRPAPYVIEATVTDEDGSYPAAAPLTVTVTDVPPAQSIVGADSAIEGQTYDLELSASGASGTVRWIVDWGDGSAKVAVTGASAMLTHTFLDDSAAGDNGVFVIRASIIDDRGVYVATKAVTVHNAAPALQAAGSGPIVEGAKYALSLASDDPGDDAVWAWEIDWGDGTVETLPGFTATARHTYTDDGVYVINIDAEDEDGAYSADSLTAAVGNVAPTARVSAPGQVDEGAGFALQIDSPVDPGTDTVTHYIINWGDGSEETVEAPPPYDNGVTPPLAVGHVYADGEADYGITVQFVDEDGIHENNTGLAVHVRNVAPSLTVAGASTVREGDEYVLTIQSTFDPGDDTAQRFIVHWGDSDSDIAGPGPITHVYRGPGERVILVDVEDEDGLHESVLETRVIVQDVPPTIQLNGAAAVSEGDSFDLVLGNVVDPGDPGTSVVVSEYHVHWGDGTTSVFATSGGVQHVYQDGDFATTITVDLLTDNGLVRNAGIRPVQVMNMPPVVVSLTGPAVARTNTPALFTASAEDPGQDVLTYSWDFGESGPVIAGVDLTEVDYQYHTGGLHTVTVTVTDDDGGSAVASHPVEVIANVAPKVDMGSDETINEGGALDRTGSFVDPDPGDAWTATVDYSDGSGDEPLPLNPDKTFDLNHTYAENGVYAVSVTVIDALGEVGSDTMTVTVNNVAPVVDAGPDATIDEGGTFTGSGSFTDPGNDTWTATVDYGDGSGVQPLSLGPAKTFDLNHVYADNGNYQVTVTVVDDDGAQGEDELTVTVNNVAPVVNSIHGVSVAVRGQTLNFSGSITDPGELDMHGFDWLVVRQHAWDDGIDLSDRYGKPRVLTMRYTGDGPEATQCWQKQGKINVIGDPKDAPVVHIIASDKADATDRKARIYFDDEVNLGETFEIDATKASKTRLESRTFLHVFDAAGRLLQTVEFHTSGSQRLVLGDQFGAARLLGYVGEEGMGAKLVNDDAIFVAAGSGPSFSFVPNFLGTHTVSLTVTDNDGGTGTGSIDVDVKVAVVVSDPQGTGETVLFVGGSMGKDKIDLKKGHDPGAIEVKLNEKTYKFKLKDEFGPPIDRIVVYGQAGDDNIKVHKSVGALPVELYGGAGKDKLHVELGEAFLSGGAGDDHLRGGDGRNILIGGAGKDEIKGEDGDDVLAGGTHAEDGNRAATLAVSAEWSRLDLDYAGRVANLSTGGGLNGSFMLNDTTVSNDDARDKLSGKKGLDWFLANDKEDKLDLKRDETLTDI